MSYCCCKCISYCCCACFGITPAKPDYSKPSFWAANYKTDPNNPLAQWQPKWIYEDAESKVESNFKSNQDVAMADVFYLHPTTVGGCSPCFGFNSPAIPSSRNCVFEANNEDTVQYNLSAFSEDCRCYAPYYRMGTLLAYGAWNAPAFELAFEDCWDAFIQYIDNYNENRPFFLAGHSQGSEHLVRLINRMHERRPEIKPRLLCAYLFGAYSGIDSIPENVLKLSTCATDTSCWVAYCTASEDCEKAKMVTGLIGDDVAGLTTKPVSTNPITWNTGTDSSSANQHLGSLDIKNSSVYPKMITAKIDTDIGYCRIKESSEPHAGELSQKFFQDWDGDYHIHDVDIFWGNIRQNVKDRIASLRER